MYFYSPAVLARAGLYTAGVVGSLAYVGATAKTDQYLYIGGPLLAGLCVVALSSLAPLVVPATAMRTLAMTEMVSMYGGLAVFGGFVLFDTQRVMANARMGRHDPAAESIGLELDFINIFIRLVQILAMGGGGRRK
jgi:growth hormone-inducible transmembrane protein